MISPSAVSNQSTWIRLISPLHFFHVTIDFSILRQVATENVETQPSIASSWVCLCVSDVLFIRSHAAVWQISLLRGSSVPCEEGPALAAADVNHGRHWCNQNVHRLCSAQLSRRHWWLVVVQSLTWFSLGMLPKCSILCPKVLNLCAIGSLFDLQNVGDQFS